jgi:hypothetical protein
VNIKNFAELLPHEHRSKQAIVKAKDDGKMGFDVSGN